jgi:hypothetical protein
MLARPPGHHHAGRTGKPDRMTALLEAALGYAIRGIPVYPVHWPRIISGGASLVCSCPRGPACDRPAKHPLLRHGVKDATIDPNQLRRWWRRWPQANVGLATGMVFDALDIDGPAGLAALHQLAGTVSLRLPGPLVATGGRWLAPLVYPDRAGQPPTPGSDPRRLARPRRLRPGPTQPPHLRPHLPLGARPGSGAVAQGADRPPPPA